MSTVIAVMRRYWVELALASFILVAGAAFVVLLAGFESS